nr:hypothetical protein [Tanacetum cinerariifolium]
KNKFKDKDFSRGHTLGSGEDNIKLIKELMETCTKLSERVLTLEESKTAQDLVSAQGEAYSQEYQLEDQLGVLSTAKVLADAARKNVQTYTRRRRPVSTGSGGISIASRLFSIAEESVSIVGASMTVSTAGMVQEVNISIPSPVAVKDKGKGKMEESEDERTKRTKLQQEQDRLGHEAAVGLKEELDEEKRQRMARRVNTFVPMETEVRGRASDLASGSSQATITDSAEVGNENKSRILDLGTSLKKGSSSRRGSKSLIIKEA